MSGASSAPRVNPAAIELSQAGYTPEQIADQYNNIIVPAAIEEALRLVQQGRKADDFCLSRHQTIV